MELSRSVIYQGVGATGLAPRNVTKSLDQITIPPSCAIRRWEMGLADRNFEMIHTNGVNLRCVVEGEGPLIILMHGWPQCWYLW
ncbi:uncharacterized protein METZ01_LOCUS213348, partial [marine metagenome]